MVQKTRGRPRQFDETEAVGRATRTFWDKGYDGVTIDDLVEAMGVARPSFYAVFGDKQALFLRCLKAYATDLAAGAIAALEAPGIEDALRGFLVYAVKRATAEDAPLGCLIVCVAPLVEDPAVQAFILEANAMTVDAVARRMRAADELGANFPVPVRARLAIDLSRGLVGRARMGLPRAGLVRDASEAAALLVR